MFHEGTWYENFNGHEIIEIDENFNPYPSYCGPIMEKVEKEITTTG